MSHPFKTPVRLITVNNKSILPLQQEDNQHIPSVCHLTTAAIRSAPQRTRGSDRLTDFWVMVAVVVILLVAAAWTPGVAHAQGNVPQSVDQLTKASPAGDESISMLNGIIGGNFFTSPLTAIGGASTLLGGMLLVFNGAIFLVAVAWGTYNLLRGIIGTAQDGEVLGKQMSAVWMPIRMVTGVAGIVPVFGGFNLAQVVYVVVTAVGIGIANMMFSAAVQMTAGFSTLLSPMLVAPNLGTDHSRLAQSLMYTEVCYLARRYEEASLAQGASLGPGEQIKSQSLDAAAVAGPDKLVLVGGTLVKYGSDTKPNMCGHAALLAKPGSNPSLPSSLSYSNPAVNYAQVDMAVRNGYAAAQQQMVEKVRSLAAAWWAQRMASLDAPGASLPKGPVDELEAAARSFGAAAQNAATQAAKQTDQGLIHAGVREKMVSGGWVVMGSWHSAFTEANSAVVDAVSAVSVSVSPPESTDSTIMTEAMLALDRSMGAAREISTSASQKADGASAFKQVICSGFPSLSTDVGSCSLGQMAVKVVIGGAASGTGGGQLIDPIVMFKNLGDWLMSAGGTVLAVATTAKTVGTIAETGSEIVKKIPLVGNLAGRVADVVGATAGKALSTIGGWLLMAAGTLLFIGAVMSVYIPLVPFITWMGGLVQYFVIFFEGMAAMTLAALAHMDTQGEGMGQRTEPGYIFLLNMIARPGLMVLGFVAASAACVALGSLQAKLFLPAIANAQGNSVTGLFSFITLLLIFLVLNWTLIQGLYNMIFLLPDNVIGILGRSGGADIGKEVEGKTYNLVAGMTRNMGNTTMAAVLGSKAPSPGGKDKKFPKIPPGGGGQRKLTP